MLKIKLHGQITREFLELRIRTFQGISNLHVVYLKNKLTENFVDRLRS